MQLAKRDLRQRRLDESLASSGRSSPGGRRSPTAKGKTKISHSKQYQEKLKKRKAQDKFVRFLIDYTGILSYPCPSFELLHSLLNISILKPAKACEQTKKEGSKNAAAQTKQRPARPAPATVYVRQNLAAMPGMGNGLHVVQHKLCSGCYANWWYMLLQLPLILHL